MYNANMNIKYLLLLINIATIIGFSYFYILNSNVEFISYAVLTAVVVALLFSTLHITKFSNYIVAGITAWVILHMAGGIVPTPDGVLYAYRIVEIFDGGGELYILKVDQFVHFYLYAIVGLMFYHILRQRMHTHRALIAFVCIFAAAGFSILNEIAEFLAVVIIQDTGVGGYYNTILDLIFNLFGATFAVLIRYFTES